MSTLPGQFLSPEEYLEIERKAEFKSEYYKGEMFAMSGGSRRHDRIATQLAFLIRMHVRGKTYEDVSSNMRVLVPDGTWSLIEANGADASITLESIEYTLSLRELYEKALGAGED